MICAIFIVSILLLLMMLVHLNTVKPKNYPPGPKWLPIVGNYFHFRSMYKKLGYHHLVWEDLSKSYGNVVGLKMGRSLVVTVFGADVVKEIFTREEFEGRPDGFVFRMRTFGKRLGIVFCEDQLWQKQKKFTLQHLRNFGFGKKKMEQMIAEETRDLMAEFRKKCDKPVHMHEAFDICVINVLWAMLAGERFSLIDSRLHELLKMVHGLFRLIDISGGVLNQMPFVRYIMPNASGYNVMAESLNRMWSFLQETIAEHKKTAAGSTPRDLIDAFLQQMSQESDETFTDEQLLSLCLDLFMAGSETTSNTLSFAVLYMLLHPDIQKKVQKEMNEVVGRNRWPSLQDRIKLPYTEAVLNEIQRIANVPPLGIAHRAKQDAELLGYVIPKDTVILTSLYNVHMDPEFWKDPCKFNPERFIDANGKLMVYDKNFVPFGYGKRRCLGESLAKANYYLFFTALLHNFNIELLSKNQLPDKKPHDGVTLVPKPFKVLLVPRTD